MSDKKKRSRFVRLLRALISLCLLVVILVWVAKILVIPSITRGLAADSLGEFWSGAIEIDDVDVNVFSASYVRGISVRDDSGRTWLNVPEVRMEMVWDGIIPRLQAARVDTVNISLQLIDGKCIVPLKPSEPSGEPLDIAELVDMLEKTEMTIATVTVRAVNNVSESKNDQTPDGVVLPMELARIILATSVDISDIKWKDGTLTLASALGQIAKDRLVMNASGGIQPDRSMKFNADIAGPLCGGKIRGDFKAVLSPEASGLTVEASADDIKMADLTRITSPDEPMKEGTGKVVARMSMSGADPETIRGRVAFFLDDAHLWNTPILSSLFEYMKLKMESADIESCVELTGTTATIVSGQLATKVWAADFEKGGTIELGGGEVDMYVIFLPIKQTGIILNVVKKFNPLNLLAKEVFRLHVTGDKNSTTVMPVLFSDLSKLPAGAMGLLESVTTTGGQLGGDIFKAVSGDKK
ncbi:MAG: hypothetical protein GY794_26345 [bacterium]|nr:hypothetical protein [bacterium]